MNKYKTIKINENFGERYGNYLLFDRKQKSRISSKYLSYRVFMEGIVVIFFAKSNVLNKVLLLRKNLGA